MAPKTKLVVAAALAFARSSNPRDELFAVAFNDALVNALEYVERSTLSRKALISSVTLFTVGLFDADDADRNPAVLKRLAETTGGQRFLPSSPERLMDVCQRIAREIRSGYLIGYVPPDRDGAFHRVRIEVMPPDGRRVTVRTRPGYYASAQGDAR